LWANARIAHNKTRGGILMTANEYASQILQMKKGKSLSQTVDEPAVCEAAQLFSGSFTYPLYEALWVNDFDMDSITQHLEYLYDSENHYGMVYFIFILANAVEFTVPILFTEISANDTLVPFLSAAIIEDWLDYDSSKEITENN
jgi:hypothetical protein